MHYVIHSVDPMAWVSCSCGASRTHYLGEDPDMANDIQQKRLAISSVYNTLTWRNKVKSMSDAQVVAIYMRFKNEGKIK